MTHDVAQVPADAETEAVEKRRFLDPQRFYLFRGIRAKRVRRASGKHLSHGKESDHRKQRDYADKDDPANHGSESFHDGISRYVPIEPFGFIMKYATPKPNAIPNAEPTSPIIRAYDV